MILARKNRKRHNKKRNHSSKKFAEITNNSGKGQLNYQGIKSNKDLSNQERLSMMGASGTSISNGYIDEEYNYLFDGQRAYDTYDEMYRSDSTIFKTILATQLPIQAGEWVVRPAMNDEGIVEERDLEISDFVDMNLFENLQGGFDQFLFEALNFVRDGVSLFEKVYQIKDGAYRIAKLGVRLPKSVEKWEMENGDPGITQTLPQAKTEGDNKGESTISIPDSKLIVFSFRKEGDNFAGVSMLRPVGKDWIIKKQLENYEVVGYEQQFRGVRKVRLPGSTNEKDRKTYLDSVADFRVGNDNVLILPGEDYDFEFANMDLSAAKDIADAIRRHDARITDVMLGMFMKLGEATKGSYGMSETNLSFFLLGLGQIVKQLCFVINNYLIKELVDLNYDNVEKYPTITCGKLGEFDVDKVSAALDRFAKSGLITPDNGTEQRLREVMGMPTKIETEDTQEEEEEEEEQTPETPVQEATSDNETPEAQDITPEEAKKEEEKKDEFSEGGCGCSDEDKSEFEQYSSLTDPKAVMTFNDDLTSKELEQLKKKSQNNKGSYARPLTFAEEKVNLPGFKKKLDQLDGDFNSGFDDLISTEQDKLFAKIKKLVESNDVKALAALGVSKGFTKDLTKLIINTRKDSFDYGKDTAANETKSKVLPTTVEQKAIMSVESKQIAKRISDNVDNALTLVLTQAVARNGGTIKSLKTAEVMPELKDGMNKAGNAARSNVRTLAVNGTINTGRGYITNENIEKIYAYQYSAILDERTTNRCLSLDGRVVAPGSTEFFAYSPPQHFNCRSIWVAILEDETFKPKITGIPRSIPAVRDVNNAKPLKNVKLLKGSPAVGIVKQEIKVREAKLAVLRKENLHPNRQAQHEQRINQLKKQVK